jgi:shikimate kinase / 3-dehydroquinate synthase
MSKSNIVLIGFMYAGKSTVGRLLADAVGMAFVDTDDLIEREAGAAIPEIFDRLGEQRFRQMERDVIARVTAEGGSVIALGGGAVLDERNIADARRDGTIYYLRITAGAVAERAAVEGGRPLLDGRSKAEMEELLSLRSEAYESAADSIIEEGGGSPEDIARRIAADFQGKCGGPGPEDEDLMLDSFETITVRLGETSYGISVGQGLLGRIETLLPSRKWRKGAVVTDDKVGPLYGATAVSRLRGAGLETVMLEIPAGERSKNAGKALEVVDYLMSEGLTRSDAVFALGGGVVGDLVGFAASVFKRGVDLVQVPTSLMAQVDSAIGGKNAVNVAAAKNQVGTFHQPVAVISDVTLLATLPFGEFRSGLAEVAKYSVLTDRDWGRAFREDAGTMADADPARVARVIAECAREKAALVSVDERDQGVRHLLNYGHTMGHALEASGGYGEIYSHGEAVSVGMVYAAMVAEESGTATRGLAARHVELLTALGLPVAPRDPVPSFEEVLVRMSQDKKNTGSSVLVLLEEEGRPVVKRGLDLAMLERCYGRLVAGAASGG